MGNPKFRIEHVNDDDVSIGVVAQERAYDPPSGLEYMTVVISADELDDAIKAARKAHRAKHGRGTVEDRTGSATPLVDPRSTLADSSPIADERPPIRRSAEPIADPPIGSVRYTGGRDEGEEAARIAREAEMKEQDVLNRVDPAATAVPPTAANENTDDPEPRHTVDDAKPASAAKPAAKRRRPSRAKAAAKPSAPAAAHS